MTSSPSVMAFPAPWGALRPGGGRRPSVCAFGPCRPCASIRRSLMRLAVWRRRFARTRPASLASWRRGFIPPVGPRRPFPLRWCRLRVSRRCALATPQCRRLDRGPGLPIVLSRRHCGVSGGWLRVRRKIFFVWRRWLWAHQSCARERERLVTRSLFRKSRKNCLLWRPLRPVKKIFLASCRIL